MLLVVFEYQYYSLLMANFSKGQEKRLAISIFIGEIS